MPLVVWAVVALAALSGMACDELPLLAPSQSTITLSTSNTIVGTNGTAEIRATVLEGSGTPVQNGTTVTFTTTLGALSPTEARTINGVATVQFVANGQSGIAEIRASSGAAKPADTANPGLKLTVGGAAAGRIVLSANPQRLPSSGGSSTITATVTDTNGTPLSSVPVLFSTNNGTLSAFTAMTGSNGQASVTLATAREAIVTATVGVTGTGAVTPATVTVFIGTLPDLSIALATGSATVQGQVVNFALTVGATGTAEPFQSIVVNFGDGSTSPTLSGSTQSVSHIYNSSGTFTVTATGRAASGDTKFATAVITVSPRTPIGIEVTPTTTTAGTSQTYTAALTPSNTPVQRIDWNFGDGTATQTTTGGARTTTHVYTVASPTPYTLTVTVTSTDGNTGSNNFQIKVN